MKPGETSEAAEGQPSMAGVCTPVKEKEGASLWKTGRYERGRELAPQPCYELGAGAQQQLPQELPYELASQSVHEPSAKTGEGRIQPEEGEAAGPTGSAGFEPMLRDFCASPRKMDTLLNLGDFTLGTVGHVLSQKLLEVLPLCSQSTGKGGSKSVFPLPTSREILLEIKHDLTDCELSWCVCLCMSLNSLWGNEVLSDEMPNHCQRVCLGELFSHVNFFCGLRTPLVELDWAKFFQVKTIDYRGDEVKVGRWFNWNNVAPALPAEIGRVPLEDVCSLGCRHYVLNFDDYLKPSSEWTTVRAPRVMVDDSSWEAVCTGLVSTGVCCWLEESEVFHVGDAPLLNGLFGVSKEEWTSDGTEVFRLIMNLIPLNALCLPLSGDVDTLPSWGSMSPFFLQPSEHLLISSEDVKCFFYTMKVPLTWRKFLAFNKAVPDGVLPEHLRGKKVFLASTVLPMGFLNSVSLAQHVHRNLVAWSREHHPDLAGEQNAPEQELRKDRAFSTGRPNWRVYLDNYDLLERVEATKMTALEGTTAPGVLALRHEYERWEVPRNVKKAVERSHRCEMQGATVDGQVGVALPREEKLGKYLSLALQLCQAPRASQRQWQVVCGGLVYVSMFRRALLGSLNGVWQHIESYNAGGPVFKTTPDHCRLEVLRFLGMFPLAKLDFRLDVHPVVTCSDASTSGGGICASAGTTVVGRSIAQGGLRGQFPEQVASGGILAIGLFDGIGALRVALELSVPVVGYVSVEKHEPARRVVERHYPGVLHYPDVTSIESEHIRQWSTRFSQTTLVLIGAGPPCQGVSGLNADRRGALKDERSCLFQEIPRIRDEVKRFFVWCPVFVLMESVASMDRGDREIMSHGIGEEPVRCDAGTLTWCHRPRLYWCNWELVDMSGYTLTEGTDGGVRELHLEGNQELQEVIRAGWVKVDPQKSFPTFTTARPRSTPGRKPAGVQQCSLEELSRWTSDKFRFPPYQYCTSNCVVNKRNLVRLPDVSERELMLGFPLSYTAGCLPKSKQKGEEYNDCRLTLLGNTWSVIVVSCLLNQLFGRLGLTVYRSPQEILDLARAGVCPTAQGRLFRLPLNPPAGRGEDSSLELARKLTNLISVKGEDILLTTPTSQMGKFARLRATIPAKCWRWKIIAGWKWRRGGDHINGLELRAILTAIRWRVEHAGHHRVRLVHLTDSLVCLHALSRGRSSSRKLRRVMSRINALILASGIHPLWGYVHTEQNPADKPSRWGRQVRSKFRHAKA